MSEKGSILKDQAEYIFGSISRTVEGITEEDAKWKPTEESNSVAWTLNHMSRIANVSIPRIIKGNQEYTPADWPEDYRDKDYTVEKMLKDIDAAKGVVMKGIGKLTSEQLEEEIPLWGGTKKRKTGIFAYLGELVHHKGQ
ncbi:DinB family protein, partial [Candidatus Bathyarchaeota archaeon]|nr:DinB family protein [Candidatus Bathyarchaeota archaeon]